MLAKVRYVPPLTVALTFGLALAATMTEVSTPVPVERPPQVADLSLRFAHLEPRVQSPDLVAYWPLDEGSGYAFGDASGGGHRAYITGHTWNTTDSGLTASFHRQGRRGGAVYLNGRQWLQVQAAPSLQPQGALTLSAWIKPGGDPARAAEQVVVSHMAGGKGYALLLEGDGTLRFVVGDDQGRRREVASRKGVVKDAWVHVLATRAPERGGLRLYVNGVLAGRSDGAPFTPGVAAADLRLGARADGKRAFRGWLDEVALHARALSPAEAKGLYAVGLPKLYVQTRETVDAARTVWTSYRGDAPVPHPVEEDTALLLTFDGTLSSVQGQVPSSSAPPENAFAPGAFGGAFDATARTDGLHYPSPLTAREGTAEVWFIPVQDPSDPERQGEKVLFRAEGEGGWLELLSRNGSWVARLGRDDTTLLSAVSPVQRFVYGTPVHLGVTWEATGEGRGTLVLYLNGVDVARADGEAEVPVFDGQLQVGGGGPKAAHGYLDDLRVSREVRGWGQVGPQGHVVTEAPGLDPRDRFDRTAGEPLWLWRPGTAGAGWRYAHKPWEDDGRGLGDSGTQRRSLEQTALDGRHLLFHPDASGERASVEAGVSFARAQDGWAGVFLQAAGPSAALSGHTFTLNPAANALRLATLVNGEVVASKTLPYDFALRPERTYTVTLTALSDGVLRGYVDGHNLISLRLPEDSSTGGFAGLMTEGASAHFDDVHFSALTPATPESRRVQARLFSDGSAQAAGYAAFSFNAFRWAKRYGLLPWERTYKYPEPPGAIFGADNGTVRPNPPQFWRSHDAANSEVLLVDGTVYYFMRGNPHIRGSHGPAAIGVLSAPSDAFTGIHFRDHSARITDLDRAELLRGHEDLVPEEARDWPPRDARFQVNDQSAVYLDGKLVVMAREFRNSQAGYPWFRRLVFGTYEVGEGSWAAHEGRPVAWSGPPDPSDPFSPFQGIDATPELTVLRDPVTDEDVIFLFHHHEALGGVPVTGVTGLRLEGDDLVLHPGYPTREGYRKLDADSIYGERVLFDNGIYYLHVNAGPDFDYTKLGGDWPDRFQLASTLHPYRGPWVRSADNGRPERPYFTRGGEFDFDNAAIWQGTMFKHRGRYYLYYETYHAIANVDQPYELYDDLQTGSRVGYATGN